MRMIALALLVFVFAGISIGLSRLDLLALARDFEIVADPDLAFETAPIPQDITTTVNLVRARPEGVMLLSDTDSVQTAQYSMLRDAIVTSGTLKLSATTQVSEGQHNIMRVLVGNQPRAEILLRPGMHTIDAEIELTPDDLATETISVRYVLVAPSEEDSCSQNGHAANIIEIEHDSRIELAVADDGLSNRDQIAAWGDEIRVGWPTWLQPEQQRDRASLALQLAVLGHDVSFIDAPDTAVFSVNDLRSLVDEGAPASDVQTVLPEWPEDVAAIGANAGLRSFHETTTWRHWYKIGATEHGSAPSSFDYDMLLGPLPQGSNWTIAVTHNGSVLDLRQVTGGTRSVEGRLSLADASFEPNNVIEISATSDYEAIGLCNHGPLLHAELKPTSRLLGNGPAFDAELTGVRAALMDQAPLTLDLSAELSLIEAQRMLEIVDQLIPAGTELQFETAQAALTPVRRNDLETAIAAASPSDYVVWLDQSDRLTSVPASDLEGTIDLVEFGTLFLMIHFDNAIDGAVPVSSRYDP